MPFCPQDPKYPLPAFSAFLYRRKYWKQVSNKDTTWYIVGPQLRLGGWHINITRYSSGSTDTGLVKNNHGQATWECLIGGIGVGDIRVPTFPE